MWGYKRIAKGLVVVLSVCILGSVSSAHGQTVNDSKLHVREVVAGLTQPTAMAFIGLNDILVLQKADGRVRRVIDGVLQPGQVLDVAVDSTLERGLLGIALHPNFPTTPFVYLYFTQSGSGTDTTSGSPAPLGNRVYQYTWNGSVLTSQNLILDLPVIPGPNHDGGTMTFGPDGKLYVVIGDLNHNGQLQNNSGGAVPDNTGVIFRVNDDGSAPADNPFILQGGNLAKYFAYGIRNSFGLAFDPVTEKLWDTENGPANYDEINLVAPGFNSGWNRIMGPVDRDAEGTADLVVFPGSHYADPKFSWFDTVAPTALVFLDSPRLGVEYQDDLFVGDVNIGNLYRFRVNATRDGFEFISPALSDLVADSNAEFQEVLFGIGFGGITDLKIGPDGLLYVLSIGLGKIFVVSGQPTAVDFEGDGKSDIAVYRNGLWIVLRSSDGGVIATPFGGGTDIPIPTDYDGDGKADITVYRNGLWIILRSTDGGVTATNFGGGTDIPIPADYDGDGKTDIAVYRSGLWIILRSTGGGVTATNFGGGTDIPIPADYDGDGKTDIAVYRSGLWIYSPSSGGANVATQFGGGTDIPVPADYDGDGKTDIAVYRNGLWIYSPSSGGANVAVQFGGGTDVPLN